MANITPRRQQAIESIRMELGIAEIYGDETVLVYARRVATESIKYHGFFTLASIAGMTAPSLMRFYEALGVDVKRTSVLCQSCNVPVPLKTSKKTRRFCFECSDKRVKERAKRYRKRRRDKRILGTQGKCHLCGIAITIRSEKEKYCADCKHVRRRKQQRDFMRKKRGYKHWVGSEAACESCGTRITVRGHAHKYCENCARERVRVRQRQKRVAARSREST